MQTSQENKDKSTAHKSSTPQSKLLVIEREFDVPVEQLFEAFTTSEAIESWWWPKDLHADHVEWDFDEGGSYFINMKPNDQGGGGMTGEFEEIIENERIVMSDQFSDEDGQPISAQEAQMSGDWPEMVYITFEFEAEGEEGSRFTMSQEGIPNEMQKECKQGWNQSFDKLEEYLEENAH